MIELFTVELPHKPDHHQGCAKVSRSQDSASSLCVQSRPQKYAANTHLSRTSASLVDLLFAAKATRDYGFDFMIDQALLGMKCRRL